MCATTIAMFAVTDVLASEPLDHRWQKDEADERRIELRAASRGNRAQCVVDGVGVGRDPAYVPSRLWIVGIERVEQRLECGGNGTFDGGASLAGAGQERSGSDQRHKQRSRVAAGSVDEGVSHAGTKPQEP